jgi:hypothetical protein
MLTRRDEEGRRSGIVTGRCRRSPMPQLGLSRAITLAEKANICRRTFSVLSLALVHESTIA